MDYFDIGTLIVSPFGIIGNIITILVLVQPEFQFSTSILLIALALSDMLHLICEIISIVAVNAGIDFNILFSYLHPLVGFVQYCSTYIIVAIGIERYIGVLHPLKAKYLCTRKNAKIAVIGVVLTSAIFTGPTIAWVVLRETILPDSVVLENNSTAHYIFIARNILIWWPATFNYFIPLTLLCILYNKIYKQVIMASKFRSMVSRSEAVNLSVTNMIICSVLVFGIFCIPAIVVIILVALNAAGILPITVVQFAAGRWLSLLGSINASINFIIYTSVGREFRIKLNKFWKHLVPFLNHKS